MKHLPTQVSANNLAINNIPASFFIQQHLQSFLPAIILVNVNLEICYISEAAQKFQQDKRKMNNFSVEVMPLSVFHQPLAQIVQNILQKDTSFIGTIQKTLENSSLQIKISTLNAPQQEATQLYSILLTEYKINDGIDFLDKLTLPALLLDSTNKVKKYTKNILALFNLDKAPNSKITTNYTKIITEKLSDFLPKLTANTPQEIECLLPNQTWYLIKYKTVYCPKIGNATILTFTNIQVLKEREIALIKEEQFYHAIFQHNALGILVNKGGKIIKVNNAICKLFGYTKEEFLSLSPKSITHPDDVEIGHKEYQQLQKGEIRYFSVEKKYIRKDRTTFTGQLTLTAVYDQNNNFLYTIPTIKDISEKKEALEALARQKDMFQLLLDNMNDGVAMSDAAGKILFINKQGTLLSSDSAWQEDLPLAQWVNHYGMFCGNDITKKLAADNLPLSLALKGQIVKNQEIFCKNKYYPEGIYLTISATPLYNEQGKIKSGLLVFRDITTQKKAAQTIADSELKYRTLVENAFDGIVFVNAKTGKVLSCNQKLLDLFRCTKEEFVNTGSIDFSPKYQPNGRLSTEWARANREVTRKKGKQQVEWVFQRKDGTTFETETSLFPLKLGETEYLIGVIKDISIRKAKERQLKISERRFRSIFEHTPLGMVIENIDGQIIEVNQAFCQMIGYSKAELLQLNRDDITLPDEIETTLNLHKKLINNKLNSYRLAKRYLRKDGEIIFVNLTIHVIDDQDGKKTCAIIEDVTEKKRNEKALAKSEQKFKAIFNNSFQFIILLDKKGNIVAANEAALQFVSTDDTLEVNNKKIWELSGSVLSLHSKNLLQHNVMSALGGQFIQYSDRISVSTEKTLTIDLSLKPVLDNYGDVIMVIVEGRDVSRLVKTQNALAKSEEKFRLLFSKANDAIFIMHNERLIDYNEKALEQFECTKEYFAQQPISILTPEKQPDGTKTVSIFQKKILKALLGQAVSYNCQYVTKTGKVFDGEVSLSVFILKSEVYIQIIIRDITEKKKAAEALAQSEALYRYIIRNTPGGGVLVFDKELKYQLCEGPILEQYGYEKGKVEGKTVLEVVPEKETANQLFEQYKKVLNGEAFAFENAYRDDTHYVHLRPLINEQQEIYGGMVVIQDITAIKKVNNAINAVAQTVATSSEKLFFNNLVQSLAETLRVSHVVVTQLNATGTIAQTIASWLNDSLTINEPYKLDGTPCEEVFIAGLTTFTEKVQEEFPNDAYLKDFDIESYIGIPLFDASGKAIGHLAVMDTKPLQNVELTKSILKIFSTRAGAELERRVAHHALLESERKFKAIFNQTFQFIGLLDVEGNILEINEAALQLGNVDISAVINQPFAEANWWNISPAIVQKLKDALKKAKNGEFVRYETPIRAANGDIYIVDFSLKPVFDEQGEVILIIPEGRDITKMKEAQNKLAENEYLYRTIAENIPNGLVIVFNTKLEILLYEGKLAQFNKDITAKYVIGKNPFVQENPFFEAWKDLKYLYIQTIEGKSNLLEYQTYGRDMIVNLIPLRDKDGKIFGGLSITQDITRIKAAERKLAEQLAEKKRYINSNLELEQFAYVVSHDLKEPLRTIVGFAQLLERRYAAKLDDTAKEYINFVIEGTRNMETLVSDVLRYSRVSAKEITFEPLPCFIIQKNIENRLQQQIRESKATLIWQEVKGMVYGSPTKIFQLFQNIISNAIKFRKKGTPPNVTIQAIDKEEFIQFIITDNGIGIEKEYLNKIFLPFKRLHNRQEYKGSGVGLAICKKVVEQHGGVLTVSSIVDTGTTFYFTLPKNPRTKHSKVNKLLTE